MCVRDKIKWQLYSMEMLMRRKAVALYAPRAHKSQLKHKCAHKLVSHTRLKKKKRNPLKQSLNAPLAPELLRIPHFAGEIDYATRRD